LVAPHADHQIRNIVEIPPRIHVGHPLRQRWSPPQLRSGRWAVRTPNTPACYDRWRMTLTPRRAGAGPALIEIFASSGKPWLRTHDGEGPPRGAIRSLLPPPTPLPRRLAGGQRRNHPLPKGRRVEVHRSDGRRAQNGLPPRLLQRPTRCQNREIERHCGRRITVRRQDGVPRRHPRDAGTRAGTAREERRGRRYRRRGCARPQPARGAGGTAILQLQPRGPRAHRAGTARPGRRLGTGALVYAGHAAHPMTPRRRRRAPCVRGCWRVAPLAQSVSPRVGSWVRSQSPNTARRRASWARVSFSRPRP